MNATPLPGTGALQAAMQRWVDADLLAGVSMALVRDGAPARLLCVGQADRERGEALREDHLFRIYSSTKLITSCALLLLMEDGKVEPGDAAERFLSALADRRVLRPDARSVTDTVPARSRITVAQLLSHTAGLSYGLFDPGTLMFRAYGERGVMSPDKTLEQVVEALAPLPLAYEPGTGWEYSVATDVVSRLVEVLSGQPFERFIAERIFQPLGMRDTGFVVPGRDAERMAAMYVGAAFGNPLKPGLRRGESVMDPQSNLRERARKSGGGGLVSTLPDSVMFLTSVLSSFSSRPGALLKPATAALMRENQLPDGTWIRFTGSPVLAGRGHGLASGLVVEPAAAEDPRSAGELYWGGLAGTQWWIAPEHGFAGTLMTQRWMGHGDPFVADLKRESYRAALGDAAGR